MATHSSILAWEISRTEESGEATVHGVAKESDMTCSTTTKNNELCAGPNDKEVRKIQPILPS